MSRYNSKKSMSARAIAMRVLMCVACLALVVTLLPQGGSETYVVKVDHPWYGREVVAPFDFPLLKSKEALSEEEDSVRHAFSPYFRRDGDVKVRMLTAWRTEAAALEGRGELSRAAVQMLTRRMQEVYESGVVADSAYRARIAEPGTRTLSIITGKTFEVADADRVYTPKTAYGYLMAGQDSALCTMAQLQRLNLSDYIQPNLVFDARRTSAELDERIKDILPTSGRVMKGTRIVDRGEIVTEDIARKLASLNAATEDRTDTSTVGYVVVIGQVMQVAIVLLALIFYFVLFRFDYVNSVRHVWLTGMLVAVMPVLTSLLVRYSIFNAYIIPYAMIPIMARIFMDSRTAAMVMLASVLLCALPVGQPYDFIVVQTVAGFVSIISLRDLSERSQLFRCMFFVTLAALVTRLSLDLIHEGGFETIGAQHYMGIVAGGFLLLLAYPLLLVIERSFGFTSNVTLVELSNINTPLLRRLSEEAPGTFQHVMQVANLAAEVANAVGAKSQLVRTGALYHDIGKLKHPAFFTENQRGINPHDRLTPVQSARVILGHVTYGLELAGKYHLPKVITDFITTHHGAGRAVYFYIKERERHPGEEVDPTPFTYPGPNPKTLEQAILMMSDAVEAASRSLPQYTDESIAALVDKIVDGQVASGAFGLCPITFRDIDTAKKVFKEKLRTIYHTRISYPDLK